MLLAFGLRRFYSPDDSGGAADDKGDDNDGGADDDGGEDDSGGAGGGKGDKGDGGGKGDSVSRADHDRALNDLHKYKKTNRDLKNQLDEQKRRLDALEKGDSDGTDWKKKYEEAEEKSGRLRQNFIDGEKYKALVPALQALGLRKGGEKLIDLIDLDDLEVEVSDRGRVTVMDVEAFAKKIKSENDWAFEAKRSSKVNGGGGGDSGGSGDRKKVDWTPEKLVELERACKRKGDMGPYTKAYAEFIEQRKARKQA